MNTELTSKVAERMVMSTQLYKSIRRWVTASLQKPFLTIGLTNAIYDVLTMLGIPTPHQDDVIGKEILVQYHTYIIMCTYILF